MQKTSIRLRAPYEEPLCVVLGEDTGAAVICESFPGSDVEDYGRYEYEW